MKKRKIHPGFLYLIVFLLLCAVLVGIAARKSMSERFEHYLEVQYIQEMAILSPGSSYTDHTEPSQTLDAEDGAQLLALLTALDFAAAEAGDPFCFPQQPEEIFRITFTDGSFALVQMIDLHEIQVSAYKNGKFSRTITRSFTKDGEAASALNTFGYYMLSKYYAVYPKEYMGQ